MRFLIASWLLLFSTIARASSGAELIFGNAQAAPGQEVRLPVVVTSDEPLRSVRFDVELPEKLAFCLAHAASRRLTVTSSGQTLHIAMDADAASTPTTMTLILDLGVAVGAESDLNVNAHGTAESATGATHILKPANGVVALSPPQRRRAVGRPPRLPASATLISQALRAGSIDRETALLYRLYDAFGDSRLPAQFHGDNSEMAESWILADIISAYDTLSPSAKNIVNRFLIPPMYEGSWANTTNTGGPLKALGKDPLSFCGSYGAGWKSILSGNNAVRVWWDDQRYPEDKKKAADVAAEVDSTIWSKLTSLMGREPLPDGGTNSSWCGGPGPELDLLLTPARSQNVPYGRPGETPAVYILLQRDGVDPVAPTAAHEIFHAIELRMFGQVPSDAQFLEYRWWFEAAAQWSMDYVYGSGGKYGQTEQRVAWWFLGDSANFSTTLPLDYHDDAPDFFHGYGSYLLPFFVAHKYNDADFSKRVFELLPGLKSLEAIDNALQKEGGLAKVWPEFARYNWNREPNSKKKGDNYRDWDAGLEKSARAMQDVPLSLTGGDSFLVDLEVPAGKFEMQRLSARYYRYTFPDNARSVTFFNGLGYKLSAQKYETAIKGVDFGNVLVTEDVGEDDKKGLKIQALLKIGDTWRADPEDWTNKRSVSFCRDAEDENITELVLIFSNSEFRDRERKLTYKGEAPTLYLSNIGCDRWIGTVTATVGDPAEPSWTAKIDVIYRRVKTDEDGPLPPAGNLKPLFGYKFEAQGSLNWTTSADNALCWKFTGSSSLLHDGDFDGDELNSFWIASFVPDSLDWHNRYTAEGRAAKRLTLVSDCNANQGDVTIDMNWWELYNPQVVKVIGGDHVIGDSEGLQPIHGQGPTHYHWDLHSRKE